MIRINLHRLFDLRLCSIRVQPLPFARNGGRTLGLPAVGAAISYISTWMKWTWRPWRRQVFSRPLWALHVFEEWVSTEETAIPKHPLVSCVLYLSWCLAWHGDWTHLLVATIYQFQEVNILHKQGEQRFIFNFSIKPCIMPCEQSETRSSGEPHSKPRLHV